MIVKRVICITLKLSILNKIPVCDYMLSLSIITFNTLMHRRANFKVETFTSTPTVKILFKKFFLFYLVLKNTTSSFVFYLHEPLAIFVKNMDVVGLTDWILHVTVSYSDVSVAFITYSCSSAVWSSVTSVLYGRLCITGGCSIENRK